MRLTATWRKSWDKDRSSVLVPLSVFALAFFLYTRALGWGLPAGDETWAADAIRPSAPLAVVWHNLAGHGWNSGWFWFKYPPLHAFLLSALYAPYLLWLWVSGGIAHFSSEYPFGMSDPIASLSMLARIGRLASASMGAGCVLLVYACVVRSFDRAAAVGAAFVVALAYPMVFYSQTTNVEVPYLFWLLLALLGAVRIVEGDDRTRWWVALGVGAACSVSTKELGAGAVVGLPLVLVGAAVAAGRPASSWIRGGFVAALSFAGAMVVANNVLFNPLGFAQRIGFLTQTLPRDIALQYAPYYFPIDLGGSRGAAVELAQLSLASARLTTSLGWTTLLLALGGWLLALRKRPAWALVMVAAVAGFYMISVRAMLSLSLRYLLPMTVLFAAVAGIALAELVREGRLRPLRLAVGGLAVLSIFAYGWDVVRMMNGDGRYAAEQWLAAQPLSSSVEIFQNRTYLPRFPQGMKVMDVPFEARSTPEFQVRQPDLVVLSTSGLSGITVRYKQDWQDGADSEEGYSPAQTSIRGDTMNYSRDANAAFLESLTAGELGYDEAARFVVDPWIERPLIQSLNPEIVVYRRRAESGGTSRPGVETNPSTAHAPSSPQGTH